MFIGVFNVGKSQNMFKIDFDNISLIFTLLVEALVVGFCFPPPLPQETGNRPVSDIGYHLTSGT